MAKASKVVVAYEQASYANMLSAAKMGWTRGTAKREPAMGTAVEQSEQSSKVPAWLCLLAVMSKVCEQRYGYSFVCSRDFARKASVSKAWAGL